MLKTINHHMKSILFLVAHQHSVELISVPTGRFVAVASLSHR